MLSKILEAEARRRDSMNLARSGSSYEDYADESYADYSDAAYEDYANYADYGYDNYGDYQDYADHYSDGP